MQGLNSARAAYFTWLTLTSAVCALFVDAFGGWDFALQTLVTLMVIDYVLGVLIALIWHKSQKTNDGTFESHASLKGLIRKGGILIVVFISVKLGVLLHDNGYTRNAVIMFFVANEGFSILENLGIMGVPFPPAMKNAFAAIKNQSDLVETITNPDKKPAEGGDSLHNILNIDDYAEVHLTGSDKGCVGDGEVAKVVSIQMVDGQLLYTGEYKSDCGTSTIQFHEGEYSVVNHESN